MPEINVEIEGFKDLDRYLKNLSGDVEPILRAGVRAGAVRVRKEAQKNLAGHRDTGDLADSLKVSSRVNRARRSVTATIRNTRDTFYGLFLEFGTVKQPPVRWLTRAVRDNADDIFRDVAARLKKRIAKGTRKKRRR